MKECSRCKLKKPFTDFYAKKPKSFGSKYFSRCIACIIEASQISKKKYPNRVKKEQAKALFKHRYGIYPEDKEKMLIAQNRRCKICNIEVEGRTAHLDHCHKTGKVRGVLCNKCNHGIGLFGDSIISLEKAILYLKKKA